MVVGRREISREMMVKGIMSRICLGRLCPFRLEMEAVGELLLKRFEVEKGKTRPVTIYASFRHLAGEIQRRGTQAQGSKQAFAKCLWWKNTHINTY